MIYTIYLQGYALWYRLPLFHQKIEKGGKGKWYRCPGHTGRQKKKGGTQYAENLPAEKAPEKKGARLPQKNGDKERTQGFGAPQSKRQKASVLLISGHTLLWPFLLHASIEEINEP